jgi:hypothetical protein
VNEIWARLRDPWVSTVLVLAAAVLVGAGLIAIGYRGAALELLVPYQLPYLVSGAFAGVALIGVSCVLLAVHLGRVEAAEERRDLQELQREALKLLTLAARNDRD